MQSNALTMQVDALTMQADALTMQADVLIQLYNAIAKRLDKNRLAQTASILANCCCKLT
jgi:hypothetical protein